MAASSIPASEHSTMVSWTRERERDAYENLLGLLVSFISTLHHVLLLRCCVDNYPSGIVACVSDSYNIFNACEHVWGELLRDKVLARDGTLIIRSDSGTWTDLEFYPSVRAEICSLTKKSRSHVVHFVPLGDPLEVLERLLCILYAKFGGSINEKGFKVLDKHVRIIQGDGVNMQSIKDIVNLIERLGFAADNLIFGSGGQWQLIDAFHLHREWIAFILGGLLQKFDRDTMKFAIKCSYVEVTGMGGFSVAKDPITDTGKRSKPGRLKLVRDNDGSYRTLSSTQQTEEYENGEDQLVTVFENGQLLLEYSFETIRANCEIDIDRLDLIHIM